MRATLFAMAVLLVAGASSAAAQVTVAGPSNQGRDCQTVRTCNFARGAEVRGCLSSYTCRTCRMVPASCLTGGGGGVCQKLRCSWGG